MGSSLNRGCLFKYVPNIVRHPTTVCYEFRVYKVKVGFQGLGFRSVGFIELGSRVFALL